MPRSKKRTNKRTGKPVRRNTVAPDIVASLRESRGELARQRQWHLDPSAGRQAPAHYAYAEDRPDDDTPMTRAERRYIASRVRDVS